MSTVKGYNEVAAAKGRGCPGRSHDTEPSKASAAPATPTQERASSARSSAGSTNSRFNDGAGDEGSTCVGAGEKGLEGAIRKALQVILMEESFVKNLVSSIKSVLVKEIESAVSDHVESIRFENANLQDEVGRLKNRVADLEAAADEAEQYSRRNCLIFSGVGESVNENTDDKVMEVCEKHLGVKLKSSDIDRSHRLTNHAGVNKGSPSESNSKQKNPPRPRNIIMKFSNYRAREAVYAARSKLKGLQAAIFINENLTRKRAQLFWRVKKANYGHVEKVWTQDGRVMAKNKSGKKVALTSEKDVEKLDQLKE